MRNVLDMDIRGSTRKRTIQVLGWIHLFNAESERMERRIRRLRLLCRQHAMGLHCYRVAGEYKTCTIGLGKNTPIPIVAQSTHPVTKTLTATHRRPIILPPHCSPIHLASLSLAHLPPPMMEPNNVLPVLASDQPEEELVSTSIPETGEDAPSKPSKTPWKTGEQLEYLYSQWPSFLANQSAKTWSQFWPRVYDHWHRTWRTQATPEGVELHGSAENAILAFRAKTNKVRILRLVPLFPLLTPLIRGSVHGSTTRPARVPNPPNPN